jgi:hypothetical protein
VTRTSPRQEAASPQQDIGAVSPSDEVDGAAADEVAALAADEVAALAGTRVPRGVALTIAGIVMGAITLASPAAGGAVVEAVTYLAPLALFVGMLSMTGSASEAE